MKTLTELYSDRGRFMITAHRGASFEFPENTAHAMRKAVVPNPSFSIAKMLARLAAKASDVVLSAATVPQPSVRLSVWLGLLEPFVNESTVQS